MLVMKINWDRKGRDVNIRFIYNEVIQSLHHFCVLTRVLINSLLQGIEDMKNDSNKYHTNTD